MVKNLQSIVCPLLVHHQEVDLIVVVLPREDVFVPSSPTMTPKDVSARSFP
jgi:hypothetical protein